MTGSPRSLDPSVISKINAGIPVIMLAPSSAVINRDTNQFFRPRRPGFLVNRVIGGEQMEKVITLSPSSAIINRDTNQFFGPEGRNPW